MQVLEISLTKLNNMEKEKKIAKNVLKEIQKINLMIAERMTSTGNETNTT
jgi:hypothetical protein